MNDELCDDHAQVNPCPYCKKEDEDFDKAFSPKPCDHIKFYSGEFLAKQPPSYPYVCVECGEFGHEEMEDFEKRGGIAILEEWLRAMERIVKKKQNKVSDQSMTWMKQNIPKYFGTAKYELERDESCRECGGRINEYSLCIYGNWPRKEFRNLRHQFCSDMVTSGYRDFYKALTVYSMEGQ